MQEEFRRSPGHIAERAWQGLEQLDQRILRLLERVALPLLRVSLGVVFVWFGVLKITGETPVSELVANTVFWVDPDWFVPLLGVFEVVVGLGLIVAKGMRIILALFALQMLGTFLVLVVLPEVAFQDGNPFLLTVEGEFVVKNLVLLSAGLMIGSRLNALPQWQETRVRRRNDKLRKSG